MKTGRPITKNRTKSLHLRIAEEELELINELAEKEKCTRMDIIIKAINEYKKGSC